MPPTGFTVTVTGLRADLSWTNQSPGTYNYVGIERKTGAGPFKEIAVVHDFVSNFYDDSVRPSTTYTYQLKAYSVPTDTPTASSSQAAVIGAAPTPVASVSVNTATAVVGEAVLVDARNSTNISKRPQDDGTPSFSIDFGDGFTAELMATAHAYMTPGSYIITFTGKNASGVQVTAQTNITVSAITAATGPNTQVLTDSGNAATNKTNLQNAINTAAANNTSAEQEIRLSGTWSTGINGTIILTPPAGNKWITIKWTGLIVPHMKRVKPSDFVGAPTILSITSANGAAISTTLNANPPAHHYNIVGIKTYRDVPGAYASIGVEFGHTAESSRASLPHHIILDRCFLFSDQANIPTEYSKDGMNIVANYITVKDCYVGDFIRDTGADSTGISISGGQGPVCIWNTEMIAGGENFSANNSTTFLRNTGTVSSPTTTSCTLSSVTNLAVDDQIAFYVNGGRGGAFSTIVRSIVGNNITFDPLNRAPDSGTLANWETIYSFVEYRRNYTWKPSRWSSQIATLQLKNLWETKSGRYFLLEGNVFYQAVIDEQPFAIVFGSASGEAGPTNVVRNFAFKNNLLRNMFSGPAIADSMPFGGGTVGMRNSDFILRNNLHRNVGAGWGAGPQADQLHYGQGQAWIDGSGNNADGILSTQVLRVFNIHNTYDDGLEAGNANPFSGLSGEFSLRQGTGSFDSMNMNNLQQDQGYGYFNQGSLADQKAAIERYFAPGDATVWNKNEIVNPNGHTYPTAALVKTDTWKTNVFVDYANGDFTLKPGDIGKNAATDGTDIGVNMTALNAAIQHTIDGDWTVGGVVLCRWSTSPTCQ
jgi:hypothetical protein